jgi:hypothetical protein
VQRKDWEVDVGGIKIGRVVLGGLLAGIVINLGETILNLVVVAQAMETTLRDRNLPPVGGTAIAGFVVVAFLLGIVTVWLYAAIRPRFGPGVGTAICAGVFVWFFAYLYGGVAQVLMGMFPAKLVTIATLWGLPEIVIASIAGAWLYQE